MLNLIYQDANKMYYDIDGQINNLYNMHSRSVGSLNSSGNQRVREMSQSDLELIRDRISLLKDKIVQLHNTFNQVDEGGALTPEKQTFWRKRIE